MPGFVETTIQSGYGYLDPYVEKVRTTVPLLDRVAKKAEVHVPPLISRVDEFTEPHVEKIRPHIEPKIERVKDVVTPYVDHGVKQYEMVCGEGVKYYNVAQDRVEKVKVHGNRKMEKLRSFHGETMEKVKGFRDEKVEKVQSILSRKGGEINGMFRVPSTDDVEGLKYKSVLGKMARVIRKVEQIVDKWLPDPITESTAAEIDDRYLLPRILSLPMTIQTRLWNAGMTKGKAAMASIQKLPQQFMDNVKSQFNKVPTMINEKSQTLLAQTKSKVNEVVRTMKTKKTQFLKTLMRWEVDELKELSHNNVVAKTAVEITEKTVSFSLATCEKTFGKESTDNAIAKCKSLLQKVGSSLPASVKDVFAAPATSTKVD